MNNANKTTRFIITNDSNRTPERLHCCDYETWKRLNARFQLARQVGCFPNELYALGYPETTDVETLKARKEALDEELAEEESAAVHDAMSFPDSEASDNH